MMEPSLKYGWLGGMTHSWVKNLGGGEDSAPLCCLPQNTFGGGKCLISKIKDFKTGGWYRYMG